MKEIPKNIVPVTKSLLSSVLCVFSSLNIMVRNTDMSVFSGRVFNVDVLIK
jgi:hypothetical protein